MKSHTLLAALLTILPFAHAADRYTAPPLDRAVPVTFKLDPGFKPPANAARLDLGIRRLLGVDIEAPGGHRAIYITEFLTGVLAGDPLQIGDVILAVEGMPLGKDPGRQVREVVNKLGKESGIVWITRSRGGKAETLMVDLGNRPLDMTRGATHAPDRLEWNLGATGAFGWTWAVPHVTTEGSTQIYVTRVEPGTPADGKLKIGDVILGAFGKPFTRDARKEYGNALAIAETEEKMGKLALKVWRQGKQEDVIVPMRVMGAYSRTSPFDCPKSAKIIDLAAAHIMKRGLKEPGIINNMNALALLATGREEYLPAIREYAETVAASGRDLRFNLARESWDWSYNNIFLAEYHLATRDESVLPAIREFAVKTAQGQSAVGTWGHSMSIPMQFPDGPRYGIAPGYGALNGAGVPLLISMALARECGVDDEIVGTAIDRGANFFRFYVDKGSIPYGDHGPFVDDHDDNGKNSMAALFFDLIGDKESATYFTKMTAASFNDREFGHTGNFFSFFWGAPGAMRGGMESLALFMEELRWFYDLERRVAGNFEYQGKPGMDKKQNAEHQYVGWDCTGARLLHYCIPLNELRITGRGPGNVEKLTGKELEEVASAGRLAADDYSALPTDVLLEKLAGWSPIVRRRAAIALQGKPDDMTALLIAMLDSDNRFARYGACEGLRHAGRASTKAADAIIAKGLASDDATLRYYAMHAFTLPDREMGLAAVSDRAVPTLLRMAAAEPPAGPRDRQEIGGVLFSLRNGQFHRPIFPRGEGLEAVDRALLIPSIRALLKETNGNVRSSVSTIYKSLPEGDLKLLWPDIKQAVDELAPSGIMFASEVRLDGIHLLAEHLTAEGLEAAVDYLRYQKPHGSDDRLKVALEIIVGKYGAHAKPYIPELEAHAAYFDAGEPNYPLSNSRRKAVHVREAIRTIQAMPDPTEPLVKILANEIRQR